MNRWQADAQGLREPKATIAWPSACLLTVALPGVDGSPLPSS